MPTPVITRSVLNDNANQLICSTMRRNLLEVLNGPMFSRQERLKALTTIGPCQDPAMLQRWYENVHKLRQKREAERTGLDTAA